MFLLSLGICHVTIAQHANTIEATLNKENHTILIKQELTYYNTTGITLDTLYFNDWNNAYAENKSDLAKRFREEFKKSLHLAKIKDRGYTRVNRILNEAGDSISSKHTDKGDILQVILAQPLPTNESVKLHFSYEVDLPNSKFTNYGHGYRNGYYLKDWYLSPAVYDNGWKLYSNKNIDDLYTYASDTEIKFKYPNELYLASNYEVTSETDFSTVQFAILKGKHRKNCHIILTPKKRFTAHKTNSLKVTTDIEHKKFSELKQGISISKVSNFILDNLGAYPHDNLLVAEVDYNKYPLYGLGLLPKFIIPYKEEFQFEIKFLKTALNQFIEETIYIDKRKERWVYDSIVVYLMIKYVEENYPNQKYTGKLSNVFGFKSYNLAKMDFNDQYHLLQMVSVLRNDHQSLLTANDSLTRWNNKIANSYKAGLGLSYLGDYIGYESINKSIRDFYNKNQLAPNLKASSFEEVLTQNTDRDINWYFKEYLAQRTNIDFKIKKVTKTEDSIRFTIKNKTGANVPISLFGLAKDTVISKYWFANIDSAKTYTIPNNKEKQLVLNYDKIIPEANQRDNWKSLKGFLSSNKKLQFRFFKDIENPRYNQLFYFPEFKFNLNDGFRGGITLDNRPIIRRNFSFSLKPQFSSRENAFVGSFGFSKRHFFNTGKLNSIRYGAGYGTSFFDVGSRFTTFTPSIALTWRPKDFISNRRQFLLLRYRNVFRSINPDLANTIDTDPDFSVLNLRFGDTDNNITNFNSWVIDTQLAGEFSKISFEWEKRKLFHNNRQLNLRLFAGKFITNNTRDSDFFSFALDRPTDYLFDLGYLDRSPDADGLASQQFILAEGGFKSIFDDRFANDWIITANASFNIWQWIEVYGDIGGVRDRGSSARFVYDSGIRLNLVTDFFELYFPVYSNNGYEIAQPNYNDRIRFVITVSPRTLTGLFTRKWF